MEFDNKIGCVPRKNPKVQISHVGPALKPNNAVKSAKLHITFYITLTLWLLIQVDYMNSKLIIV